MKIRLRWGGDLPSSQWLGELVDEVEIGRQHVTEPPPPTFAAGSPSRLIVAPLDDRNVSRRQLRIKRLSDERIEVENLSGKRTVSVADEPLRPSSVRELRLPVSIRLDTVEVCIGEVEEDDEDLQRLERKPSPPQTAPAEQITTLDLLRQSSLPSREVEVWVRALESALRVLSSATHDVDFFHRATEFLKSDLGFERAAVIRTDDSTTPRSGLSLVDPPPVEYSRTAVNRARSEQRTFWRVSEPDRGADSLVRLKAVVASPILSVDGEVIAVLYGEAGEGSSRPPLSRVDALIVEVVASAIAAGIARRAQERRALEATVRFEQFFTPELTRALEANPNLLDSRTCDITVLFADLVGFSEKAERLDADVLLEWLRSALGAMSSVVLEEGGVLVDYTGDQVFAMWGAPEDQPDHADRACRAATRMVEGIRQVSEEWADRIGGETECRIGLNSGPAVVGNIGTPRKFKYGPVGAVVNLGSRIQETASRLGMPTLLGAATVDRNGCNSSARFLGAFAFAGHAGLVDVHEPIDG